jgi:hypothetical protein
MTGRLGKMNSEQDSCLADGLPLRLLYALRSPPPFANRGSWSRLADNCPVVPPWDHRRIDRVERQDNRFLAKHGLASPLHAVIGGMHGEISTAGRIMNGLSVRPRTLREMLMRLA